jgi:hypothetical protein
MAEIHFTMNFSFGPLEGDALTLNLRKRKLAPAEIHRKVISNG